MDQQEIENQYLGLEREPLGPTEHQDLTQSIQQHLESTQRHVGWDRVTLLFDDPVDEELYRSLSKVSLSSLGMVLVLVVTVHLVHGLMDPLASEWLISCLFYIPFLLLSYLALSSSSHLYILAIFYSILTLFISRSWLVSDSSVLFDSLCLVLILLFAVSFSLELRFFYTIAAVFVSLVAYLVAMSLKSVEMVSVTDRRIVVFGILAAILGLLGLLCLSYIVEFRNRLHFISYQRLIIFNYKLQKQLKGLESSFSTNIADLESPLEKAMVNVKLLLASPHITGSQIRILHDILECLNSSNLTAPDLYRQIKGGGVVIDKEEEKWLFNELARSQTIAGFNQVSENYPTGLPNHTSNSTALYQDQDSSSRTHSPSQLEAPGLETLLTPEIAVYLGRLEEYNFPIFEFAALCNNRPLFLFSHTLVVNQGMFEKLHLPPEKFLNFMFNVENGYRSTLACTFVFHNLVHNSLHAADVLHGISHLCQLDKIKGIFSDLETLAIFVAAAVHDYDHPGVNNNFLIATNDRKALFYNDKSVLENHHCSASFSLLLKPENNFLAGLDKNAFTNFRSCVVDMVLATDLAQHFDLLTRFKQKVVTSGTFDPYGNQQDRHILMQMLMKCADVSNPTKEWPLYREWIDRIMTEFYNQGDLEKQLGLPVSPFMNRDSQVISAQKGFIEFIVYPLFEALEFWTPLNDLMVTLNQSRDRFVGEPTDSPDMNKRRKQPNSLHFVSYSADTPPKSASEFSTASSSGAAKRRASVAIGNRRSSVVASIRSLSFFGRPSNAGLGTSTIPNSTAARSSTFVALANSSSSQPTSVQEIGPFGDLQLEPSTKPADLPFEEPFSKDLYES